MPASNSNISTHKHYLAEVLVGAVLSLVGCGDVRSLAEPLIYARTGGMSPQTEFALVKRDVDTEIEHERAGERPVGEPTWKAYWQSRYDLLRFNIARYRTQDQQYIDYIHQQRSDYGLPLYDSGKLPSQENYAKQHRYQ